MRDLVPTAIVLFFAFATGFFVVLSYIEKPIWLLMFDPTSSDVGDDDARLVHAELKRIITLAPPTMITVMGSGTVFTLIQAGPRNFDRAALTMLAFLVLSLGYILAHLGSRIRAVVDVPSEGEIDDVRRGLGRLAALHHIGLATAAGLTLLQFVIGIGW